MPDGVEAIDADALINAVPHSVVLMRAGCRDGQAARHDVEANPEPGQSGGMSRPKKTAVLVHNCTVLLVMSWSDVTDALTTSFNALWS